MHSSVARALTTQLKLLELASSLFLSSARFERALLANAFFDHRLHEFEVYGETASVEEALELDELRREDAVRVFMWPYSTVPRADFPDLFALQMKRVRNVTLLLRSGPPVDQELRKRAEHLRAIRRSKTKYYQSIGKNLAEYIENHRHQSAQIRRIIHCKNSNYGRLHASTFYDLVNEFLPSVFHSNEEITRASKFKRKPIVFEQIHPQAALALEIDDLFICGDDAVNAFELALKVYTTPNIGEKRYGSHWQPNRIMYHLLVPFFQYKFFKNSCELAIALKASLLLISMVWDELRVQFQQDSVIQSIFI